LAAVFLILHILITVYYLKKRSGAVLAYIVFFQELHILLFNYIGSPYEGMIYYLIIVFTYITTNIESNFRKSKIAFTIKNPLFLAIVFIKIMLLLHLAFIGLKSEQAVELVTRYFIHLTPVMFLLIVMLTRGKTIDQMTDGIIVYGALLVAILIFIAETQQIYTIGRGHIREQLGINPIQIARLSGMIILTYVIYLLQTKDLGYKVIYAAVIFAASYLMIISLSRGPIVALTIGLVMIVATYDYNLVKKYTFLAAAATAVFLASFFLVQQNHEIVLRFQELEEFEETSRFTRLLLFIELFKDPGFLLFGLGPEGYGYVTRYGYPHNLIIEFVSEYGIVGIISTVLILVYSVKYIIVISDRYLSEKHNVYPVLLVYYFVSSMFSGNIIGNRNFFFIIMVIIGILYVIKYKRD